MVLALKILAAFSTCGIYPILPAFVRWHQRAVFRHDVRRQQYRNAVRRAAR